MFKYPIFIPRLHSNCGLALDMINRFPEVAQYGRNNLSTNDCSYHRVSIYQGKVNTQYNNSQCHCSYKSNDICKDNLVSKFNKIRTTTSM